MACYALTSYRWPHESSNSETSLIHLCCGGRMELLWWEVFLQSKVVGSVLATVYDESYFQRNYTFIYPAVLLYHNFKAHLKSSNVSQYHACIFKTFSPQLSLQNSMTIYISRYWGQFLLDNAWMYACNEGGQEFKWNKRMTKYYETLSCQELESLHIFF